MQWTPPPSPERTHIRSLPPLSDECLDRLYRRGVAAQLQKRRDYERHMTEVVDKMTKVKKSAVMYDMSDRAARQLFYFPIDLKQKHLNGTMSEIFEESVRSAAHHAKLSEEEQQEVAKRLCNESMEKKRQALQELQRQANDDCGLGSSPSVQAASHSIKATKKASKSDALESMVLRRVKEWRSATPLSPTKMKEVGDRLSVESLKHKSEELGRLESRYLFRRDESKRISAEELKASCDRMYKGEGRR